MVHLTILQPRHWGEFIQVPILTANASAPAAFRSQVQLVTLPCPVIGSRVTVTPTPGRSMQFMDPALSKAKKAAELFCRLLGMTVEGVIEIKSYGPQIGEGLGTGTSSADVIGTLRAIAKLHRLPVDRLPNLIGQVAQRIEGGVDPLHCDSPVLFASREGRVLRHLGRLPAMRVVGFVFPHPVDTVELVRAQAKNSFPDENIGYGAMVIRMFEAGIARHSVELLGAATTLSARLNQALIPFPCFAELAKFARAKRVGLAISHSGGVGALLLKGNISKSSAYRIARELKENFKCSTLVWRHE